MAQSCVFELKSDSFLYHKDSRTLCLTGVAADKETVVLFRATLASDQSREKSRREFEAFRQAAREWSMHSSSKIGFFVVDLHANQKLVATSQNSHTNLAVASSICIFYSNGKPQVLLKKINESNDVLAFCKQGLGKIYSSRPAVQNTYSQQPQPTNAKYYTPEGLNQPSTAGLRNVRPMNNDHENNLLTPENIIPYNTPWKNENE